MGNLQEYYIDIQINLDSRNLDLRMKRDLRKIIPASKMLVIKLLDLGKKNSPL